MSTGSVNKQKNPISQEVTCSTLINSVGFFRGYSYYYVRALIEGPKSERPSLELHLTADAMQCSDQATLC